MCDPLTIAGLVLTGASAVANTVANNQVRAARNEALMQEHQRQQGYDAQVQPLNDTSRERYAGFQTQQDQRAQNLSDFYRSGTGEPVAPSISTPAASSNVVVQEENKQRDKAKAYTDQNAQNLGNLRSFGDLFGSLDLLRARDAGQIAQLGGFKRASSGILPYELNDAQNAGNGAKLFGDILGGAGSVATMGGLTGGTIPGMGSWNGELFGIPLTAAARQPINLLAGG
jgi:hypothetical protein